MIIESTGSIIAWKALSYIGLGFCMCLGFKFGNLAYDHAGRWLAVHNPRVLKDATKMAEEIMASAEKVES